MAPEAVPLEDLPSELRSRVRAATAHAQYRHIDRRQRPGEEAEEYEVFAVAGDRFVHMVLALRPEGSVDEATDTFLRDEIVSVGTEGERAVIEVLDAGVERSITAPPEVAAALARTS
jgi:hypothetical protein